MAEPATKLAVHTDEKNAAPARRERHPLESLQRAVDRIFDDFDRGFWRSSFRAPAIDAEMRGLLTTPATDVVEHEGEFVITVELPGMDAKDVDVKLSNNVLTVTGEKKEEHEEKKKDYFLSERSFGSFRRSFQVPDSVETDKIDANFNKGVLTVSLPKSEAGRQPEKKISVKGEG
jgi:HSP20 family protein